MAEATKSKTKGAPRPLTAVSLENAALHYLGRFASSSANLQRILLRKVARHAAAAGGDAAEGEALVAALIARYRQSGLLDDRAYAAQQAASLVRRGASRFSVAGKLAQKGIPPALVKEALAALAGESEVSELAAACALVRRRRLGPYRRGEATPERQKKELATLARAGFSLDLARRVLAAPDIDAIEALARGGKVC